tara:strand:+ start:2002 stop:2214 length:213 start_codon:yes stop_codon:yes gene_type:complete
MAEIKITKKAPIWPWVLLIIIIIAGLFFLFFYGNTEDTDTEENTEFEEVTYLNIDNSYKTSCFKAEELVS